MTTCLQGWKPRFNPWVGKILWRRKWQSTPVFLPGEFHGQRSLVGYSPWGHKESDTTKQLTLSLFDAEDLAPSYITHPWSSSLLFFLRSRHICNLYIPTEQKPPWIMLHIVCNSWFQVHLTECHRFTTLIIPLNKLGGEPVTPHIPSPTCFTSSHQSADFVVVQSQSHV